MKRLLIVSAVWGVLSALFWLGMATLGGQWQSGETPKPDTDTALGLFVFVAVWGFTALVMGVWWLIGLTRWIFGKPREKRTWVEQIPLPPAQEERPQYTITGKRLR